MVLTVDNLGSVELVELEERIYSWFAANAPQYEVVASSPSLMFAHIGETNMASMLSDSSYHLSTYLWLDDLVLRSVRLGMISLAPKHCAHDHWIFWFMGAYLWWNQPWFVSGGDAHSGYRGWWCGAL